MIPAPGNDAGVLEWAEWLELEAFCRPEAEAPLADAVQPQEIEEEEEPSDDEDGFAAEDIAREERLGAIQRILYDRTRAGGDAYPYTLDPAAPLLKYRGHSSPECLTYVFSLLLSNAVRGRPLAGVLSLGSGSPTPRTLFESIVSIAMSGCALGPSYVIGSNRAGSAGLLVRLRHVYGAMGDGRVHDEIPPGAPLHANDDGVDVVAWRHATAPGPRPAYWVAQAATGLDWVEKNTVAAVSVFHETWFHDRSFRSTPSICTCIPFSVEVEISPPGETLSTVARERALSRYERSMGQLFDRFALAERAMEAGRLGDDVVIEGRAGLPDVLRFVDQSQTLLRNRW